VTPPNKALQPIAYSQRFSGLCCDFRQRLSFRVDMICIANGCAKSIYQTVFRKLLLA